MRNTILAFLATVLLVNNNIAQDYRWPLDYDANEMIAGKNGLESASGVSYVNDLTRYRVLSLDGVSGFITLPLGLLDDLYDVTITCWFNYKSESNWTRVYSFGNELPNVRSLFLSPKDGWKDNKLHLGFGGPDETWKDYTPTSSDTGTWYFTAFIKYADTLKFYLNDSLMLSDTTYSLNLAQLAPDSANYIGKSHWDDPLYKGLIDDLRIYKRALDSSEIVNLYKSTLVQIKDTEFTDISIYSAHGKLYIKLENISQKNSSLHIFNLSGCQVYIKNDLDSFNEIDLKSGFYIVRIISEGKIISEKILVN